MLVELNLAASVLVIAAVRVVLPWLSWPIIQMLTWGLRREDLLPAFDEVFMVKHRSVIGHARGKCGAAFSLVFCSMRSVDP